MTPPELNKEIALLHGWKPVEGSDVWIDPSDGWDRLPPDYASLWEFCGPLLEELETACHDTPELMDAAHRIGNRDRDVTLKEAIAAAWYEWQKGKP